MRKLLVVFLVAAMTVLIVSYVSAGGQDEQPTEEVEVSEAYQEADIDWRILEGESINVLVTNAHYFNKMRAITPQFERLTGIEVTFEVIPPREMRERAVLDLSTGSAQYATHTGDPMYLPLYVANGWIEPLDQYINDPELTDNDWFDLEDIVPLWRQANSVNDTWYAMPAEGETTILLYRKDLYEELGLEVPETLEELRENAAELDGYQEGLSGVALRGFRGAGQNMYIWPSLFLAFGGQWFDDDGNITVDTQAGINALEYYVEVLNGYAPEGVQNWNWPDIMEAFASGSVAQFIDSNSTASIIEDPSKSQVAGEVGYARWPEGPGDRRVTSIWNWAMPINSDLSESKKQATWLYLQWIGSRPTQFRSATLKQTEDDVFRTGVNRLSIWNDPEFRDTLGLPEEYFDVVLTSLEEDTDADWRPRIPEWPDLGEIMAIAIQEALTGQASPREALSSAQEDIDQLLGQ